MPPMVGMIPFVGVVVRQSSSPRKPRDHVFDSSPSLLVKSELRTKVTIHVIFSDFSPMVHRWAQLLFCNAEVPEVRGHALLLSAPIVEQGAVDVKQDRPDTGRYRSIPE